MVSSAQQSAITEQIRQLEKEETTAVLNDDFLALNRIWHPHFTVNTPLNRILRTADILDAMKTGLIKYSFLERNLEDILIHDHVVVTLGNEVTIPTDKAPMAGQRQTRRFTNVWIREHDEWRMFSRHASNICEADK